MRATNRLARIIAAGLACIALTAANASAQGQAPGQQPAAE